jgi:drug/metabolite transporter (DMT)-like permease
MPHLDFRDTQGHLFPNRGSTIFSILWITHCSKPVCRYLILDEKLGGLQLLGASVTLLSIYLVNRKVQPDSEKTD